MKHFLYSG